VSAYKRKGLNGVWVVRRGIIKIKAPCSTLLDRGNIGKRGGIGVCL